MVEESDCSAKEKRRRIMESLKGPALGVVKAVRNTDPEVSPKQCLEAIESAFGSAETGEDLYFAFRLLQQQPKEKLSDFLRRLELSLTRVVQRGGLPPNRADRARVEQLLRGAVHSDIMLVQLKLRERRECPPSFLELLSEIRSEEEYESSRLKLNSSVRRVQANADDDSREGEIQSLKSDIKELKAMFTAMTATNSQVSADKKETELMTKVPVTETCVDTEVAALKKQVKKLQNQLTSRKPRESDAPAAALKIEPIRQARSGVRQQTFSDSDGNFCYRCGETGHFSAKCRNPENQGKVIQKLIRTVKKSKQSELSAPQTEDGHTVCVAKKSEVTAMKQDLPRGLIGPSSLVPVKINGQQCDALLDSASKS